MLVWRNPISISLISRYAQMPTIAQAAKSRRKNVRARRSGRLALRCCASRRCENQVRIGEQTGGQVKMTFTGNVSSLGYLTSEDAKLNVNVRAKGGASLHSWSFEVPVKCADKDRPLTPLTHDVPSDVAANVFSNVSTVEIAEPTEANYPGSGFSDGVEWGRA